MASSKLLCSLTITLILWPSLSAASRDPTGTTSAPSKRIYAFGDSYTDTGNTKSSTGPNFFNHVSKLPFGSTFFHHPTNRYSDGRPVIDFVAQMLSLPFLPPYRNKKANISTGVNFAVAGSTAIPHKFFVKNNLIHDISPQSIQTQLIWFNKFFEEKGCKGATISSGFTFDDTLFWIGEIGVNDYAYTIGSVPASTIQELGIKSVTSFLQELDCFIAIRCLSIFPHDKSFSLSFHHLIRAFLHAFSKYNQTNQHNQPVRNQVVKWSGNVCWFASLQALLKKGAKYLVVQCLPPTGCLPLALTLAPEDDRDAMGCVGSSNKQTYSHNTILQGKLHDLRIQFPHAVIVYADYWNAYSTIMKNGDMYGFKELFKTCCGSGGDPYNFEVFSTCGASSATVCPNPSEYINWDGIHLTEAMYKEHANLFPHGRFCHPPFDYLLSRKQHLG